MAIALGTQTPSAYKVGSTTVSAVYMGGTKVWPPAAGGGLPVTAGLAGWWDASDAASVTSDANGVSLWKDKSPNGYDAVIDTVGWQPHYASTGINGKGAISFDSTAAMLKSAVAPDQQPCTVVSVSKYTAGNTLPIWGGGSTNNTLYIRVNGTRNIELLRAGMALVGTSTGTLPTTPSVLVVTYDTNANNAAWAMYVDGVSIGAASPGNQGPLAPGSYTRFGADSTGTQNSNGMFLGEMIKYNRVLSTPERQQVEAYLTNKWMAFTPAALTGLAGWWDADDASTFTYSSSTLVSQWRDKSGAAKHLAQATVGVQPNRNGTRNGKSTVVFGNNPYVEYVGDTLVNVGTATIFAVVADAGSGDNSGIVVLWSNLDINDYDSVRAAFVSTSSSTNQADLNRYSTTLMVAPGAGTMPWSVLSAVFKSDGSGEIYRNGTLGASPLSGPSTFQVAGGGIIVGGRHIGGQVYATARLNGDIGEIVVYNRVLTTPERQQVEAYLTTKWIPATPTLPVTSGLAGWWDANDASTFTYSNGNDGANPPNTYVSQWRDLSGNNNHANGDSNAGYHPKRNVTINGLPAVDYSTGAIAVVKSLAISTLSNLSTKPSSYLVVVRPPNPIGGGPVIGSANGGVHLEVTSTGGLHYFIPAVADIATSADGFISAATPAVVGGTYSATGGFAMYVNGTQIHSGTVNASPTAGTQAGLGSLGGSSAGTGWSEWIGEAVVYNRVLTTPERQQVEAYLKTKWGTP